MRSGHDAVPSGFCAAASGTHVQFREVTRRAELEAVLRLRYQVLCAEQGYCHSFISGPSEMLDRYDGASRQLGGFRGDELVAAVRLVHGGRGVGLPSAGQLPKSSVASVPVQRCAEISRVAVAEGSRGVGLFVKLLALCLAFASQDGMEGVVISERTSERYASRLRSFGFVPIFEKYVFRDACIEPRVLTTTYLALPLGHPGRYLERSRVEARLRDPDSASDLRGRSVTEERAQP